MEAHQSLWRELEEPPWLVTSGHLQWAEDLDAIVLLHKRAARLAASGYPCQLMQAGPRGRTEA